MKFALEGIRIIEHGHGISAAYCSKLLADSGAEVIKLETPDEGDNTRKCGPFVNNIPGRERSGLFMYLNTNKFGVTLNIEKETGRDVFKKMITDSDILIEDNIPGKLSQLGLDYESELKVINPSLIITTLTPFGQTGPYRDYKGCNLTIWNMAGIGYLTPRYGGTTEQEPLTMAHLSDYLSGMTAAYATMCALRVQRKTGIGQRVDLSQLEANILALGWTSMFWPYEHRSVSRASRTAGAPEHFLRCKDGWIYVNAREEYHWQRFVDMMGNPDWAQEELFQSMQSRAEHWGALEQLIMEWTMQHNKAEIFALAKDKGVPMAPVNTIAEAVDSRQLKERDFFSTASHPVAGKIRLPGVPYRYSTIKSSVRSPAPLLGQHNEEIYCRRLGYSKEELIKLRESGVI